MKPNQVERRAQAGYVYKTDALLQKIANLTQQGKFTFATGSVATPKDLAQFMFKINFLTARKWLDSGELDRKYFGENRYLSGHFVDYGYEWEIHPAYRWALQPDSLDRIYEQVELGEN